MSYVQYGCERVAPAKWVNFDCSPTLRFERIPLVGRLYTYNAERFPENVRYGDIVKGLPIADRSCDAVYCSHVLEHLSLEDFDIALRNTYRILKPGGVFRLVVPDLEIIAKTYLNDPDTYASSTFVRWLQMGRERRRRGVVGFLVEWLGNGSHLWMWDERSMRAKLEAHGFRGIRRAALGDSGDPMFTEVESEHRFKDCLAMQCQR